MSRELAQQVIDRLTGLHLFLVPVESCTGGALAHTITNLAGASGIISDGFIVYSNDAKLRLGMSAEALQKHTVYSAETATELAKAGLKRAARGDVGVDITGSLTRVDPANPNSVPGQAYIAVVWKDKALSKKVEFPDGDRAESKALLVKEALRMILLITDIGTESATRT